MFDMVICIERTPSTAPRTLTFKTPKGPSILHHSKKIYTDGVEWCVHLLCNVNNSNTDEMLPPQPSPLCLSFSLLQSLYPESSLPLRAQCQLQFFLSRFLSRNRSLYRFTFQFMYPALFSLVVLSLCPFPLAFLP